MRDRRLVKKFVEMFLADCGVSRDRTGDLLSFRGSSLRSIQPNHDSSDRGNLLSPPPLYESGESPLERFFQLATEIKQEIIDLHACFETLLKKHKECFRPTFADSADTASEINTLTSSISSKMQLIFQKINYLQYPKPEFPYRSRILANLRGSLTDSYQEFATKFKIEQQAFSASFGQNPDTRSGSRPSPGEIDFESLNFGTPADEQRQIQLRNQQNEEEIMQIVRRAEDIRNIFADLATLIHDQGTIIDRIDFCIQATLTNALEAHSEVEKAASYQKKSRLWICVIILSIVIVILFLMALAK
jgi:syntaxin 16